MPPRRSAQPQGGWGAAKDGARSYIAGTGEKPKVNEDKLNGAVDAARAEISNWTEWNWARKVESFTTDSNAYVVLSSTFSGELGVYQTTGNKAKLVYITPDEYEQMKLNDSATSSELLFYTILNAKEVFPYPLPASGVGLDIVYLLDLMDADTELPPRFYAAQRSWILHHYGAPPPDGKYSWRDIATDTTDRLRIRDRRPSGRRPLIPNIELEEVAAIEEISIQ